MNKLKKRERIITTKQKNKEKRNEKTILSTRTLQLGSASMKATFNETACDVKSRVLTSNFPDNHSFWRSLTYTDASTTSHTPHMHAQNGRKMTVIVFYRVTMDKVVGAPRITHLLTVTFGSRGCKSDVLIHAAKCLQWGLLKKYHAESRWSCTATSVLMIVSVCFHKP